MTAPDPNSDPTDPVRVASRMGMLPEPSEEFLEAFSGSVASIVVECEFCGRTYFDESSRDYNEGELERLREGAAKDPDKFIGVDGYTSIVVVDGKHYAWGCKCHMVRQHENWIWANRLRILKFLEAKCKKRLQAAEKDMESMQSALTAAKLLENGEMDERHLLRDLLGKYPDESTVRTYIDGESRRHEAAGPLTKGGTTV